MRDTDRPGEEVAEQTTNDDNRPGAGNPNIAGRDLKSPYIPPSTKFRNDAPDSICDNNNHLTSLPIQPVVRRG